MKKKKISNEQRDLVDELKIENWKKLIIYDFLSKGLDIEDAEVYLSQFEVDRKDEFRQKHKNKYIKNDNEPFHKIGE